MPERIVLDPSELASGRTELDITPWLAQDGIDWGDAEVSAYQAPALRGAIPVDYTVPNRSISGGLIFSKTVGGTTTAQARTAIATKMAQIQREGGWLKRVTNSGGTVFTEIVNATFRATSVSGLYSARDMDLDASFSLEAIPEFYENEVTDSDNSTTTARELIFTQTGLSGDNPARVRLVVDNDGTTDWRGLIWAFRSRHFPRDGSHQTTAKVTYGAEELQPLDTATKVALSGAHGGTVVTHGTVSTNWTPVVGTNIGGTSYMTHTGTYRVWGRVYSTSGTLVQSRFVWDVGDFVNPAENTSFRMPGASNYYIMDYGEIRLDPSSVGTHRWQGQIQAKGNAGAENFSVDKVWLQNTDEGAGVITSPLSFAVGLATYSARSEFNTESGVVTGDSLAVGGTWAAATGSDTDDYSESNDELTRTAVSDTAARIIYPAGMSNLTTMSASLDFKRTSGDARSGLVVRYEGTDSNDYLLVEAPTSSTFRVAKVVGGSGTVLASTVVYLNANAYYTIRAFVNPLGQFVAEIAPQGATSPTARLTGTDSVLATSGALASGKAGIYDFNDSSIACTRTYDNFGAWVPAADAVAFASRSVQLGTEAILRQDSGGTAYGPVTDVIGDLPRLPTTSGTIEVALIPSSGDFDTLPDTLGTASISARPYRRPSWLYVDDA